MQSLAATIPRTVAHPSLPYEPPTPECCSIHAHGPAYLRFSNQRLQVKVRTEPLYLSKRTMHIRFVYAHMSRKTNKTRSRALTQGAFPLNGCKMTFIPTPPNLPRCTCLEKGRERIRWGIEIKRLLIISFFSLSHAMIAYSSRGWSMLFHSFSLFVCREI